MFATGSSMSPAVDSALQQGAELDDQWPWEMGSPEPILTQLIRETIPAYRVHLKSDSEGSTGEIA